jgi:hypothetical protein
MSQKSTDTEKSYILTRVDCTEEAILNEEFPNSGEPAIGWRRFRINYRNEMGFSNIEGTLYFPPNVDPYPILDDLEKKFKESIPYGLDKPLD